MASAARKAGTTMAKKSIRPPSKNSSGFEIGWDAAPASEALKTAHAAPHAVRNAAARSRGWPKKLKASARAARTKPFAKPTGSPTSAP